MKRRLFIYGGLLATSCYSFASAIKIGTRSKKSIPLSSLKLSSDHTDLLLKAEAEAYASGSTLTLPAGTEFRITKPILFRVSVQGNNSKIIALNSRAQVSFTNFKKGTALIENLTFDGNSVANGVHIDRAENLIIRNCSFENCKNASLSINESVKIQVSSNKFSNSELFGIYAEKVKGLKIVNNSLRMSELDNERDSDFIWVKNSPESIVMLNRLTLEGAWSRRVAGIGAQNPQGKSFVEVLDNKIIGGQNA